jgi:hypothetical protein
MAEKNKVILTGPMIEIKGSLSRHLIVKKVVNTFIKTEYLKKGKGISFRYPVETLPDNQILYISRPGHKKNFDFKVEVIINYEVGEGSHKEIAENLRKKRKENSKASKIFWEALTQIYDSKENDVNVILKKRRGLRKSFKKGGYAETLLKILKWMFIMEDIVYWDNEGRAFLFNFLRYFAEERNAKRLTEALNNIKNPDGLKRFMRKCGMEWMPCEK